MPSYPEREERLMVRRVPLVRSPLSFSIVLSVIAMVLYLVAELIVAGTNVR